MGLISSHSLIATQLYCYRCGGELHAEELFGQKDFFPRRDLTSVECPQCGWRMDGDDARMEMLAAYNEIEAGGGQAAAGSESGEGYYDESEWHCNGECDGCPDEFCPEHPANAHLYYPQSVCPYAGIGSYNPADPSCERCGDRTYCEEVTYSVVDNEHDYIAEAEELLGRVQRAQAAFRCSQYEEDEVQIRASAIFITLVMAENDIKAMIKCWQEGDGK